MDATDLVIGIGLIGTIAWVSIIALNLGGLKASTADLYAISEINKVLISNAEVCQSIDGFELVQPNILEMQPYYVTAGKTKFNQTYFCFYKKIEKSA